MKSELNTIGNCSVWEEHRCQVGQVGQNQSSYVLSESRTVALYHASLQLSFWRSAEPELEEEQMEHMTGFLLPRNVDITTPGFQRHNDTTKCKHLLLTLSFSPLITYNLYLTVCACCTSVRCLQMLSKVQIRYSERLQEI